MSRALRSLILVLSGALWCGDLSAQTPSRPEIVSLTFEGNENATSRALENSILTRETTCRSIVLRPLCWIGRDFALDRSYLSPREFESDFVRVHFFYRARGYRGVRVDTIVTRHEGNTADIAFVIREGEPHRITTLNFFGLEDVGDRSIVEDLPIRVGDPLNTILMEAARDTLTQRLRNRGYAHADVLRSLFIPVGSLEGEVEYDVYTGPRARIGPIDVVGNEEVATNVIRRMLPFQEGAIYSQEQIFQAQRNIYNLEIFSHASILQDLQNEPDSIIPLQVRVNEGDARRVYTGGGWNTAECFDAEARWSSLNYFGGARRLVLRGRLSNLLAHNLSESICTGSGTEEYSDINWVVSSDFTQPFIFSPRNALSVSLYAERQSLQDVFVRSAVGASLSLTRTISRATSVAISYRPQYVRLDAAEIFFCTSFLVCDPRDIDVLQAPNRLSPVGIAFSRNRTNRVISPTGGYTFFVDLEHASSVTGSDFGYERALAELTGFYGISDERVVLAARVRGGWLTPKPFHRISDLTTGTDLHIAHPQKRFYAGGANSVRGFSQNQLGPQVASIQVESLLFAPLPEDAPLCTPAAIMSLQCDASSLDEDQFIRRPTGGSQLLEGSLEIRFPVWAPLLRGAVFMDFGTVQDAGSALALGQSVITPGIGLRYSTPIGPIRIDLAYRGLDPSLLPVVTSQIRPFDPATDSERSKITGPRGEVLDWVRLEDLALLQPRVVFDRENGGWLRHLQLHLSIGQAF